VKPKDSRNSGGAWVHALLQETPETGGIWIDFFPCLPTPAVRVTVTCKNPKNTQGSWFLSDSRICLFPFWICFVLGFAFFSASLFSAGCSSGRRFSVGNVAAYVGAAGGRRTVVGR
jgi:hypothetical protein